MANKETRSTTPPVTVPSPDNSTDNGEGSGNSNSNSSNNGNGVKVVKSQRKRDKKIIKDKDKGDNIDGDPDDKMVEGGNNRDDDNSWDCTVCTYKNPAEAFKCLMCDVRKGTSTRKPRINPELVAQQVARQQQHLLQKISHGRTKDGTCSGRESRESNRDGNSRDGLGVGGNDSKERVKDTNREGTGRESSSSRVDNDSGPETKKHSSSSSSSHKQTKQRKSVNKDDTPHGTSNHSHNRNNNNNNTNYNNNNIHVKSSSSGNNFSSEAVTVNNVTVIITEFSKDLKDRSSLSSLPFSQLN